MHSIAHTHLQAISSHFHWETIFSHSLLHCTTVCTISADMLSLVHLIWWNGLFWLFQFVLCVVVYVVVCVFVFGLVAWCGYCSWCVWFCVCWICLLEYSALFSSFWLVFCLFSSVVACLLDYLIIWLLDCLVAYWLVLVWLVLDFCHNLEVTLWLEFICLLDVRWSESQDSDLVCFGFGFCRGSWLGSAFEPYSIGFFRCWWVSVRMHLVIA